MNREEIERIFIEDGTYLCSSGHLHNARTNEILTIPYCEMPAEICIHVLLARHTVLYRHPRLRRPKKT